MTKKVIGFDTETTGFSVSKSRILSAALVEVLPNKTYDAVEIVINPGVEVPPEAAAVHGMTTEWIVENGGDPKTSLVEISRKLQEADEIVIYNAPYDLPLLTSELERHGLPTLPAETIRKVVDPLVLDRHYDKPRRTRTLGANAQMYGVTVDGSLHNATTDVITMLKILDAIKEKFPELQKKETVSIFQNQCEWDKRFLTAMECCIN